MLDGFWLSPFRREIFEPLVCLLNGTPLRRYWKEIEKTQYMPEAALRDTQWKRLESLLAFAWEKNSFYRERFEKAGISPEKIRSPEDLQHIPVLTKEEIRLNSPQMISHGFDRKGLMHFKTGGSTGKSLDLFITEECSIFRYACARRHDRWTGWNVGEPVAAVWGNPTLPVKLKETLKHWLLKPYIYLDTMNVTEASVRQFACDWQRVKPTLLYGHAHSIYVLAQFVRDLDLGNIKPRGILSTSMMLMPHERNVIEDVFGVKVTNRYGCEEVSLIASECEKHNGMHLNIEHLYVEFVKDDGTYAAAGEPGRIIVTDLMNRAMPFIRYEVEDIGVVSDRKCTCGRGLPLMEHVTGRVADFLVKKDGTKIAGVSLIENTLTKIPGIDQMQIIQESLGSMTINLVVNSGYTKCSENSLAGYISDLFDSDIEINLNYNDAVALEKNGKFRFSICKV